MHTRSIKLSILHMFSSRMNQHAHFERLPSTTHTAIPCEATALAATGERSLDMQPISQSVIPAPQPRPSGPPRRIVRPRHVSQTLQSQIADSQRQSSTVQRPSVPAELGVIPGARALQAPRAAPSDAPTPTPVATQDLLLPEPLPPPQKPASQPVIVIDDMLAGETKAQPYDEIVADMVKAAEPLKGKENGDKAKAETSGKGKENGVGNGKGKEALKAKSASSTSAIDSDEDDVCSTTKTRKG